MIWYVQYKYSLSQPFLKTIYVHADAAMIVQIQVYWLLMNICKSCFLCTKNTLLCFGVGVIGLCCDFYVNWLAFKVNSSIPVQKFNFKPWLYIKYCLSANGIWKDGINSHHITSTLTILSHMQDKTEIFWKLPTGAVCDNTNVQGKWTGRWMDFPLLAIKCLCEYSSSFCRNELNQQIN